MADVSGFVLVSAERLKALEELETSLPKIIENAKNEYDTEKKKERLKKLHQLNAENPEIHAKKMLEKYHKNKEEINAKRREAYRLKKEAAAKAAAADPTA
jgi:hypothetical protein